MNTRRGRHYCIFDTAIGPCGVAWSEAGLTRLQLPERDRAATEQRLRRRADATGADSPPAHIGGTIAGLQRYLAGGAVDFSSVVLDLAGVDDFNRRVYDAARRVGFGRTITYGELARQLGAPNAARAVGRAMAQNPVPVVIPCHRVLASGGRVGGFSAHRGTFTKEKLLALEGVHLGPDAAPALPLGW